MTKLRNIDMFAGIGGFSLGLHRTGSFETVAFVENNPYASKVLASRFPGVPNLGDVTTCEFPEADFITAGFPCQDISNAGQRAGITGSRSGLYGHVVRAIRLVRPRGALLENVAALLGRGLDTVLGDLAEIGNDAKWNCVPASAVGAAHIRDRIWIYTYPQHPDANSAGSYRAPLHVNGSAEPGNKQACFFGSLGKVLADATSERRGEARQLRSDKPEERATCGSEEMADAASIGLPGQGQLVEPFNPAPPCTWEAGEPLDGRLGDIWAVEPNVGRVAHGVPARVDRLRCLGNAVVPQVVEAIGRAILASLAEHREAA